MPLRNAKPLTLRLHGATDAIDGTNAPKGSMFRLSNVVPSTRTMDTWEPRPAAVYAGDLHFRPDLFPAPIGQISVHLVVGNLCFGMCATGLTAGYDQPFVCDLTTGGFIPVFGVTAANVPATQSPTGNWNPPKMAQVGQRIVVTHPGFPGALVKFGWFDISSFSASIDGYLTSGSTQVVGVFDVTGLQPGMTVAGTGIPGGTTLVDIQSPFITVQGDPNNAGDTVLNLNYTQPSAPVAPAPFIFPFGGQAVNGPGIVAGSVVVGNPTIVSQTQNAALVQVTISIPATGTSGFVPTYSFSGEYSLIISQPATVDGTESLLIKGGTRVQPLWGSGDTAINHLPSQPVGVAQYNGECWFACGIDGAPFSDPLLACVRTNASQAITTDDGLATTAIEGLPLTSALTGGIIQALVLFEGASKTQEITGDFFAGTLTLNELNIPTGTVAPRTVAPSMLGLAFVSPEGLRIIDFGSRVSEPIGAAGTGITLPFMFSQIPTRMALNANADIIRVAVENDLPGGQFSASRGRTTQEWWFHVSRKVWSGPHSLTSQGIQPWTSPLTGVNTFIITTFNQPGMLLRSDSYVSGDTTYEEGAVFDPNTGFLTAGNLVRCGLCSTLLPDTGAMAMNAIVETALALKMPSDHDLTIRAYNEAGELLDEVTIAGLYAMPITGQAISGAFLGYAVEGFLNQYKIPWHVPLVFKQCFLDLECRARFGVTFGNWYLRYQVLGDFDTDFPYQPMTAQIEALLDDVTGQPVAQALIIPGAAPMGTKIGTVVVRVGSTVIVNPLLTLSFNELESDVQTGNQNDEGVFAIEQFSSSGITGDTNGTTALANLSADVIAAGWDIGMSIVDSAFELGTGETLAAIAGGGLSATLGSAAAGTVIGDEFTVTGQNLVTNWTGTLAVGLYSGQIKIEKPGFRTSYFDFFVTVT